MGLCDTCEALYTCARKNSSMNQFLKTLTQEESDNQQFKTIYKKNFIHENRYIFCVGNVDDTTPSFPALESCNLGGLFFAPREGSEETCAMCGNQVRNEERGRGCLRYMGDEKLPSYVETIINYCKDHY